MFYATFLFTILLRLTASIIAAPAPLIDPDVGVEILLANHTSPSINGNGTETIPYRVDRTPITLFITPLLGQNINRNDLIIALYDSREYIRRQVRYHGDKRLVTPFDSSQLPAPPAVNCVVKVENGQKLKSMTWKYLEDAVQGLMDYTFFPYTASVNSLTFMVSHEIWGEIGSGSLEGFKTSGRRPVDTA